MKTVIEMARNAGGDDWGLFQEFMPEIHKLAELVRADTRNATLDEIAKKIEAMPFGDTAASFAVWIREQKK